MREDLINELSMPKQQPSIITVIGVGGAGGNALDYMWKTGIKGVNFLACNTDQRALDNLSLPDEYKIVLGDGQGAGNNPERGQELANKSLEQIKEYVLSKGTRIVFITAGMGGGTGTGASPVIAKMAHDEGMLTVANVTSPLLVEGPMRCKQAAKGIEELQKYADSLLVINNESIREMYGKLPIREAFGMADDILAAATKGIAELVTVESAFIRVDFADLDRVMRGSGRAHMGVASAAGEDRALEAARRSLCSPLLNNNEITGAKKILINISAADVDTVMYDEAMKILTYIQSYASYKDEDGVEHQADVIWGMSSKPMPEDALEVVVVATGFCKDEIITPISIADDLVLVDEEEDTTEPEPEPQKIQAMAPPPRHTHSNLPPILERKRSRYTDIPSGAAFIRRGVVFVTDNSTRHKEVLNDDQAETQTNTENSLF